MTPASDLIARLREVDSATVANAIEALNQRPRTAGFASMELKCFFTDLKPMVGYAVTCTADSTTHEPTRPNRIVELLDAVAAAPKPVVVVIQNCGPDRPRSCFAGDMIAAVYQKLGAVGIVTDGGVRDIAGIRKRAPGFQMFGPGTVVSHGTVRIVDVGIPVSVGDLQVLPGDLLHGDESGIVTIPAGSSEDVLREAAKVYSREQAWFDFVASGDYSLEGLKQRLLE